jgi:hypothetical protein
MVYGERRLNVILKRIVAALTAIVCVLFGLYTLSKYGAHVTKVIQSTPSPGLGNAGPYLPDMQKIGWHIAPPTIAWAAEGTIIAQLKAFKRNDYQTATVYQSVELKRGMHNPVQFRTLIKTRYPEFASYKSIVFGPVYSDNGNRAVQIPAKVTGTDGKTVSAVYIMLLEGGAYRVAGVDGGLAQFSTPPAVRATIS